MFVPTFFAMPLFDELTCRIALTCTHGVGPVIARKLLALMGSAEAIFADRSVLARNVEGISDKLLNAFYAPELITQAQGIATWVREHCIDTYYVDDPRYPALLGQCADAPSLLYYKGKADLMQRSHILSVVGTRSVTAYGRDCCHRIIQDLAKALPDLVIVSGLAYGVDVEAHSCALSAGLDTIAVLAHGLDRIYPHVHRRIAAQIVGQGGLLTEYPCGTNPDRYNFVARNRIIAGLSHATLVIESSSKGGSLITARLANEYDRETLAIPGRISDRQSAGCNKLIASSEATCVNGAEDILDYLNWGEDGKSGEEEEIFRDLPTNPDGAKIVDCLLRKGPMHIDQLGAILNLSAAQLLNTLFELEFEGYVNSLPGGIYDLR